MLTERDKFKIAFLTKCANDGLTPEQILERVESLRGLSARALFKHAQIGETLAGVGKWFGGAASAAGEKATDALLGWGVPLAVVAPPVLGAAAGYGLGRMQDVDPMSSSALRDQELIQEYQRNTAALKRMQAIRAAQAASAGRMSRPMY